MRNRNLTNAISYARRRVAENMENPDIIEKSLAEIRTRYHLSSEDVQDARASLKFYRRKHLNDATQLQALSIQRIYKSADYMAQRGGYSISAIQRGMNHIREKYKELPEKDFRSIEDRIYKSRFKLCEYIFYD